MVLEKTKEYLLEASKSIQSSYSAEFIALDIRNALNSFAELTGEITSQDILDQIFSSFCIGK
jgi:tRNA modification GTPase